MIDMSTRVFFTSDLHFSHANILKFESAARPFSSVEEMNREIITRWNSVVKAQDLVWVLGDICLGGKDNINLLGLLNGRKKLVLGNHDNHSLEVLGKFFEKVYGVTEYGRGWVLSHMPIHPAAMNRFTLNVHGHMHSKTLDDPRYFNVSLETHDLYPWRLEEIRERVK